MTDIVGLIGDVSIIGGGIATAVGAENVAVAFDLLGVAADATALNISNPNVLTNAINNALSSIASSTNSAIISIGNILGDASNSLSSIANASPPNQSTIAQQSVANLSSSIFQNIPAVAGSIQVGSLGAGTTNSGNPQVIWTDSYGNLNIFTTEQDQSRGANLDSGFTTITQGPGQGTASTTQLFDASGSAGQVTSIPDANGDGGSSLRFATPAEQAALNGTSIDATQVTPNGNGTFTVGSPQADPAGLGITVTLY